MIIFEAGCAPHGACELKSNEAPTYTDLPRCAPHGACELKYNDNAHIRELYSGVAPRMGRVS